MLLCGCQGKGWIRAQICTHMITVHCWCFEYNPPVNIRRTLALIKRMQTKQQLVVKFLFPCTALKRALVALHVVQKNWREPLVYIMRRKVLVFITWRLIKAGLSISNKQSVQVDESQGVEISIPKGVFI